MIEKILSIQDTMFVCGVVFILVKWIQRKEGWGWK